MIGKTIFVWEQFKEETMKAEKIFEDSNNFCSIFKTI